MRISVANIRHMIATHAEFHKYIAHMATFPAHLVSHSYDSLVFRIFRACTVVKCLLAVHASHTLTKFARCVAAVVKLVWDNELATVYTATVSFVYCCKLNLSSLEILQFFGRHFQNNQIQGYLLPATSWGIQRFVFNGTHEVLLQAIEAVSVPAWCLHNILKQWSLFA
jgi:hypothetical protein